MKQTTCREAEFDAFRKPITSFPSGSIRLNVTAKQQVKHHGNLPKCIKSIPPSAALLSQ